MESVEPDGPGLYELFPVPESKSNVLEAMCVTNTSNTIFAPSVSSGTCVFVGEVWWCTRPVLALVGRFNYTGDPGTPDFVVAGVDLRQLCASWVVLTIPGVTIMTVVFSHCSHPASVWCSSCFGPTGAETSGIVGYDQPVAHCRSER